MDKLYLKDLEQGFIDRNIPFIDSVYPLLASSTDRQARSFINVTKEALGYFHENYVYKSNQRIHVTGGTYTFVDNYDKYLAGEISEEQIILVPFIVHTLGNGVYSKVTTWWEYRNPTLYTFDGSYNVRCFSPFPLRYDFNADGTITDDSHIAGISLERIDFFYHQFDLTMLRSIKLRTKMVSLSTGFDFIQLDERISELSEQVDKDKSTASDIYDQWR